MPALVSITQCSWAASKGTWAVQQESSQWGDRVWLLGCFGVPTPSDGRSLFLPQALCGCTVNIPTIDGRVIPLPCNDIIKPGTVKRLRGEGLPFPKAPSQRGDLIVEFKIRFPDRIAPQTRQILKQHLPCS